MAGYTLKRNCLVQLAQHWRHTSVEIRVGGACFNGNYNCQMAQSKSRRQQISAVTRETNMEMGRFAGRLRQGWSVEKDQRAWKGLSAPRVGADNRAEGSSCLISQSVLECTVRRRTLVLSPRRRTESPPRGYNLQSLSRRNETEAISHLDGLMDYLQKVPQLIFQSAATQQRETSP